MQALSQKSIQDGGQTEKNVDYKYSLVTVTQSIMKSIDKTNINKIYIIQCL